MSEPAQVDPERLTGSFSKLLATFTSKLQDGPWDDSELANDVATITYEQALRATRRVRDPEPGGSPILRGDSRVSLSSQPSVKREHNGAKKQRVASVTIRVTAEEQAQLHERAKAAQLSVSGYLRSCIFEAESLRSQVKEALAHMQVIQNDTSPSPMNFVSDWRRRLFGLGRRGGMAEG